MFLHIHCHQCTFHIPRNEQYKIYTLDIVEAYGLFFVDIFPSCSHKQALHSHILGKPQYQLIDHHHMKMNNGHCDKTGVLQIHTAVANHHPDMISNCLGVL
eukprot:Gb_12983 [translate_table: standard]